MDYKFSLVYVNRLCPMKCKYCSLKIPGSEKNQLSAEQWKKAFDILDKRHFKLPTLVGLEPLMLKEELVEIVKYFKDNNIPHVILSTLPDKLFNDYKQKLLDNGLSNITCAFDSLDSSNEIGKKSIRGLKNLNELKALGLQDSQLITTVTDKNLDSLCDMLDTAVKNNHWIEFNIIHWNKDGKYDFFPAKEEMSDLIITDKKRFDEAIDKLKNKIINENIKTVYNPLEYFDALKEHGMDLNWHCGCPNHISVDYDGTMRLCVYRSGEEVRKFSIFDLEDDSKYEEYLECLQNDAKKCPGCFLNCEWMFKYFIDNNDQEAEQNTFIRR